MKVELSRIGKFHHKEMSGNKVILTGPNGSGKTTLLLSVAAIFAEIPVFVFNKLLKKGEKEGFINLVFYNTSYQFHLSRKGKSVKTRYVSNIPDQYNVNPDLVYINFSTNSLSAFESIVSATSIVENAVREISKRVKDAQEKVLTSLAYVKATGDEAYRKILTKWGYVDDLDQETLNKEFGNYEDILNEFHETSTNISTVKSSINELRNKLSLADKGLCPVCKRPFSMHVEDINRYKRELKDLLQILQNLEDKNSELKKRLISIGKFRNLPSENDLEEALQLLYDNPETFLKRVKYAIKDLDERLREDFSKIITQNIRQIGIDDLVVSFKSKSPYMNDVYFKYLSSGEKTIVNIASASAYRMYTEYPLPLLIDESLDSLDQEWSQLAVSYLYEVDYPVWMVSHRPDIIEFAESVGFTIVNVE